MVTDPKTPTEMTREERKAWYELAGSVCAKCEGKVVPMKFRKSVTVSGEYCNCLLSEMQCKRCGNIVERTGYDSSGVGIYVHSPCGIRTEFGCFDPRTLEGR